MKIYALLTILLLKFFMPQSEEAKKAEQEIKEVRVKPSYEGDKTKVLNFFKRHEGFNNGYPYICQAGYKTIGYGHVIKKGEIFPDQITRRQGDSLLHADFNDAKRMVKHYYPELEGKKLLALAHLTLCKGIGTVLNKKVYSEGVLDTIKVKNMKYPQNRRFEIDLFY